jgi:hypothetical protein
MGEYADISPFADFAREEASRVAGKSAGPIRALVTDQTIPPALSQALSALGTAVLARQGL